MELIHLMNEEVFPQLVKTYYLSLYRFALSLTRHPADASDLTQQTFFIWATKSDALREIAKAKAWLFTTLYREFLRGRRRDSRITSLDEIAPADQDPLDCDTKAISKIDAQLVMAALQEIDPAFREPLTLFYLQDFSYSEISEILFVPVGTVMSRLSRGKSHLRARFAEKAKGGKAIDFPQSGGGP